MGAAAEDVLPKLREIAESPEETESTDYGIAPSTAASGAIKRIEAALAAETGGKE